MAVTLNERAFEHAKKLIAEGKCVLDERDLWSEHQPTTEQENRFIAEHGFGEYGKWYLGLDKQEPEDTKERYKFPYGDFKRVHRCGVLSAESRAGEYHYHDVEAAAAHLHSMLDAAKVHQPT